MIPNYTDIHLDFKINSLNYSYNSLIKKAYSYLEDGLDYEQELGLFLLDWLNNKDHVFVKTSGSTGSPKTIKIQKQAMVNSAMATGAFFNLKPGDQVLHCLPSNFIAGKMMMVRAMVLGLEIDVIKPALCPLINSKKKYKFSAFIPMQLKHYAAHLNNIETLIVGGGKVSSAITNLIKNKKTNVYETYGMTETVSHIAVKKINTVSVSKEDRFFSVLPGIKITQDKRGCLVIEAPNLCDDVLVTNDIVNLVSNSSFKWLGRYDNVINSGGIKLFPEQIEHKLQDKISNEFFIASIADDDLGEKLILVLEGDKNDLDSTIFEDLDKYEKPKEIFVILKFKKTVSGKTHRKKTLEALNL